MVLRGPEQYVLGQELPASMTGGSHVLLGAGEDVAGTANAAGPEKPGDIASCKCPCCIQIAGRLVCCD